MISRIFSLVILTVLLWATENTLAAEDRRPLKEAIGLSREHIVENHKRRRSQLQKLLQESKEKLDDHHSGRNLMEDKEYEVIKKRVGSYEQKLERMPEEPDDVEIQRTMDRFAKRRERMSHREL